MAVNNVSSNNNHDDELIHGHDRLRQRRIPTATNNFQKMVKRRDPSQQQGDVADVEETEEEEENTPSLFDLSSKKVKPPNAFAKPNAKSRFSLFDLAGDTSKTEQEQAGIAEGENRAPLIKDEGKEEVASKGEDEEETEMSALQEAGEMPLPSLSTKDDPFKKPINTRVLNPQTTGRQQEEIMQAASDVPRPNVSSKEADDSGIIKKDKSKSSVRSGDLSQEKTALGNVNAGIQSVAFSTEKAQLDEEEGNHSSTIKQLATQILDRVQIMRRDGQTDTTVTLRQPLIFQGATLTLTTSDHATKEYNVAFANLSPDAKLFLDRKLTEDSLTQTLERKGIVVHIVTTSTLAEAPVIQVESGQLRDQQRERGQQQQQERQSRNSQDLDSDSEGDVT